MKTAPTYVFLFVPIPAGWLSPEPMIPGLRAGSNGSLLPEQKHHHEMDWPVRDCGESETETLPNHLFWTWFVDNPRLSSC
jgi:hypothetical protein